MTLAMASRRLLLTPTLSPGMGEYITRDGALYRRLRGVSGVNLRSASGRPLYGRVA